MTTSVVNKLGTSLTDNARVVFYNHHMFIVQATGVNMVKYFALSIMQQQNKLDSFTLEIII